MSNNDGIRLNNRHSLHCIVQAKKELHREIIPVKKTENLLILAYIRQNHV